MGAVSSNHCGRVLTCSCPKTHPIRLHDKRYQTDLLAEKKMEDFQCRKISRFLQIRCMNSKVRLQSVELTGMVSVSSNQ